jgi:hypothetical protein
MQRIWASGRVAQRCPSPEAPLSEMRRTSRTSLAYSFLDHATVAQAPAVRSAGVSESEFLGKYCGAAGSGTGHWAPQSIFRDYNAWPTAQLCPACHALWHNVMRAGAAWL